MASYTQFGFHVGSQFTQASAAASPPNQGYIFDGEFPDETWYLQQPLPALELPPNCTISLVVRRGSNVPVFALNSIYARYSYRQRSGSSPLLVAQAPLLTPTTETPAG